MANMLNELENPVIAQKALPQNLNDFVGADLCVRPKKFFANICARCGWATRNDDLMDFCPVQRKILVIWLHLRFF